MLSINTNLSSIIAQESMKQSTNKLNQAIERMSSGFKINHASDNAANYSISTNMTTRIGAYQVAEDNAAMGLDMLNTASKSLSLIEDKLSRLRALATQAQNGTYGGESLSAIQAEADSITKEIERLYSTAEYNGVRLLDNYEFQPPESLSHLKAKPEYNNFIDNPFDYTKEQVEAMDKLSGVTDTTSISSGLYSISTPQELAQLAKMVNDGYITGGEFVLADDIDLSSFENWTPIGTNTNRFLGIFNGNGHIIKNLKSTTGGLFGYNCGTIKNVALINCKINSSKQYVGGILNFSKTGSMIKNVYLEGNIIGHGYTGAIVGYNEAGGIEKSYAKAEIKGAGHTGGISGYYQGLNLKDCFYEGTVNSTGTCGGGIVGGLNVSIQDCYSIAVVQGIKNVGGVVGLHYASTSLKIFENCHAYGTVTATATTETVAELIGAVSVTSNDTTFGSLKVRNCSALSKEQAYIGKAINYTNNIIYENYDSSWLENVSEASLSGVKSNLQVGINGSINSNISVNTNLKYKSLESLQGLSIQDSSNIKIIDNLLLQLEEKQVELGAAQNRLESALDEISTQYENLVSARSTLRDADMAEVSSTYIQQQILQEASATLMATANQSPAIALQLI